MNLKKKIKSALAWALKDELLEIVEHSLPTRKIQFVERTTQFQTLKLEFKVREPINGDPREYEQALKSAKEQLFDEVERFIEVESFPLISHEDYNNRYVRLKLRIQQPTY